MMKCVICFKVLQSQFSNELRRGRDLYPEQVLFTATFAMFGNGRAVSFGGAIKAEPHAG
jgi:hypothetical protein